MKMTEEEAKKIEDCMDKPEFMGLFRDYVKDISDPANMEEYDQYIRQLEDEGEIPDDEEVVRPEKGFCIKTRTVDVTGKIFVNCCGTDSCPPPTQRPGNAPREEGSTGNPGKGAHWSLPYIYTSCRMDQDNKKEPCHVYDVLFNTQALRLSENDPRFQSLVTQTALECLEEAGKLKLKDPQTGKIDFSIMKNLKYKGHPVRPHRLKKDQSKVPWMPKAKTTNENTRPNNESTKPKKAAPKAEPEDPTKPKVTVLHRGQFEMSSTLVCHGNRDEPLSSRPKELIVRIDLPLMKSSAEMELETRGGFLELEVPGVYSLKHRLPFPVDEASGNAKYNKTVKQLTVTLSVLPWKPEEMEEEIARVKAEREREREEQERAAEEERVRKDEDAKKAVKRGFLISCSADEEGKEAVRKDRAAAGGPASKAPALEDEQEGMCGVEAVKMVMIENLGKVPEREGGGASGGGGKEVEGGTPQINFRQNEQNVTMIVRVANVEEESVRIVYEKTRVELEFVSMEGTQRKRFKHTLHPSQDIDPLHCRHDVSSGNMVVILKKLQCEKWATFTGAERDEMVVAPPASLAEKQPPAEPPAVQEEAVKKEEGEGKKGVRWADAQAPPPAQAPGQNAPQGEQAQQEGDADFDPCKAWAGSRPRCVFKMGQRGLGYYRDTYTRPEPQAEVEGVQADEDLKAAQKALADRTMDAYMKAMPKLGFANNLMFELD